jgi:hypothetical protein
VIGVLLRRLYCVIERAIARPRMVLRSPAVVNRKRA